MIDRTRICSSRLAARAPLVVAALGALALAAPTAAAGELDISAGADAKTTTWDGDGAGYSSLSGAWWFNDRAAIYFTGKLGIGLVDDRVLQYLDLGGKLRGQWGPVVPFVRAGLVHQHEVPRDSVEMSAVANLGGWGDGIRHRGGASAGAGFELPFATHSRGGDLYLRFEVDTQAFLDDQEGPQYYFGAGVAVGMTFDIALRISRASE